MKNKSIYIIVIAIILVITILAYLVCGYYKKATHEVKNPIVTIEVQDYGIMKLELYPDMAPNTVSNFIALANNGFYDGLKFHRIVKDFMVQGGDKNGDGSGSPSLSDVDKDIEAGSATDKEYCIPGEILPNGYQNTLRHEKGVISMARTDYTSYGDLYTESYNSGGSQFFIMTKDSPSLNGLYAAFGKVIEGMDILDKLNEVEVEVVTAEGEEPAEDAEASTPVTPVIIKSVTVDTFGEDYGKPITLDAFDINAWFMQNYSY